MFYAVYVVLVCDAADVVGDVVVSAHNRRSQSRKWGKTSQRRARSSRRGPRKFCRGDVRRMRCATSISLGRADVRASHRFRGETTCSLLGTKGPEAPIFGAWLFFPPNHFQYKYIKMKRVSVVECLPFTICLCLLSQLLGWSFRWSTTWLLCSRLVRSYQAVAIIAFSRWRFLMICSCAACIRRQYMGHSLSFAHDLK